MSSCGEGLKIQGWDGAIGGTAPEIGSGPLLRITG